MIVVNLVDFFRMVVASSTPKINMKFMSRVEVRKFVNLYSSRCKCKMVIISGGAQETSKSRKIEFG